jgi:hypothetical protein
MRAPILRIEPLLSRESGNQNESRQERLTAARGCLR